MALEDPRSGSLTDVIKKIVDDVRELFREEVALARAELRQEMNEYSGVAMRFAVGGAAAGFAALFILLAIAQGFAMLVRWPVWAGYLTLGIVLGIVGAAAILTARSRMETIPAVPPKTAATIKETKEWIQDRMTSEPR